jgi:predicted TIM-barrel fold metal-dependent hydrolase
MFASLPPTQRPSRSFLDVWQHNFYITMEEVLNVASVRALLEQTPLDRILYGSNYPFEERGKALMMELRECGVLRQEEWVKIASGNAEVLFKLKEATRGGKTGGTRSLF